MAEVEVNLWRPLSAHARQGFEGGAGSELARDMRALHSSSALAANFFDYWTDRDKAPLLAALGIESGHADSMEFEARFSTGLQGAPPHLDVAIGLSTGLTVGIESKFTEHLKRATRGKSEFVESYFPSNGGLWAAKGLAACQAFAEELRADELGGGRQRFEYVDPRQLLKHALGLATQLGDGFSLYYLYYDWDGARAEAHRREVAEFASRVGGEIGFKALTYQEVYERLRDSGEADPDDLDYLGARYFTEAVGE